MSRLLLSSVLASMMIVAVLLIVNDQSKSSLELLEEDSSTPEQAFLSNIDKYSNGGAVPISQLEAKEAAILEAAVAPAPAAVAPAPGAPAGAAGASAASAAPAPAAPSASSTQQEAAAAVVAPAVATSSSAVVAVAPAASSSGNAGAASTTALSPPVFTMNNILADEKKMAKDIAAELGGGGIEDGAGALPPQQDQYSQQQPQQLTSNPDDSLGSSDGVNSDTPSSSSNSGDGITATTTTDLNQSDDAKPPSAVEAAEQRDEQRSFAASEQPAVGDNQAPDRALGSDTNRVLKKDVDAIYRETDPAPMQAWQRQICRQEEGSVSAATHRLSQQQKLLTRAYLNLHNVQNEHASLSAEVARTLDEHKTAQREVEAAARVARERREQYMAAIARTNQAKVNVVRERAGDETVSIPQAERQMNIADAEEKQFRDVYRESVHARLFAEEAERRSAAQVSEAKTGMDRSVQLLQRAEAARLDAIAEVDAADVKLQRARLQLFACYSKLREAADTVAAIRGESLAKAAMSGVSDAAHIHGGGV